jgi:phosphatidylserine/phosphatidylglycerophosphate/cardiolipin synthase-like enzyme
LKRGFQRRFVSSGQIADGVARAFARVKDVGKVKLRIRYDATTGSKISGASRTVDPKPPKAAHVKEAGLGSVAEPITDRGGHLMHDKFIIRDGTTVWTGSGNVTNGGLHLKDNNYLIIEDQKAAAAYQRIFDGLMTRATRSPAGPATDARRARPEPPAAPKTETPQMKSVTGSPQLFR